MEIAAGEAAAKELPGGYVSTELPGGYLAAELSSVYGNRGDKVEEMKESPVPEAGQ